ncbi:hypothetical protein [Phytohabitans houttuyneae]|uniref:Uncharacterized protein n=1 Tax=Phytohabitans houttuyneae TaxID=1076126 RepID=A0A6V8K3A0_9ACTN|nr:hypothetical protein [Phytohabitans houttuyneae]GFJ78214.1 hypothetical protein Phou_023940 [Phytohabitans houttuyneae]
MTEDIPAEVARLRNAISCELHAQLALRGETIDLAAVPEVAYAVALRLREAFAIEWAPRGEQDPDDDGSLGLDAAVFHASSLPTADRYPIFDHGWPRP